MLISPMLWSSSYLLSTLLTWNKGEMEWRSFFVKHWRNCPGELWWQFSSQSCCDFSFYLGILPRSKGTKAQAAELMTAVSCMELSHHNHPNQIKCFTFLSKVISATAATTREQAEHSACHSSFANPPVLAPPLTQASWHSAAAARAQQDTHCTGHTLHDHPKKANCNLSSLKMSNLEALQGDHRLSLQSGSQHEWALRFAPCIPSPASQFHNHIPHCGCQRMKGQLQLMQL